MEHNHFLLNGHIRNTFKNTKKDFNKVSKFLINLVKKINMKLLSGPHVSYSEHEHNNGITAILSITTSHIAMHIWNDIEPHLIQFDIYTCSYLPIDIVLYELKNFFDFIDFKCLVLDRTKGFKIEYYNECNDQIK